jgi:hypothetical protein
MAATDTGGLQAGEAPPATSSSQLSVRHSRGRRGSGEPLEHKLGGWRIRGGLFFFGWRIRGGLGRPKLDVTCGTV